MNKVVRHPLPNILDSHLGRFLNYNSAVGQMFASVWPACTFSAFEASNDVLPHEPGNSDISGLGFFSQEILQNTGNKGISGPKRTAR